MAVIIIGLTLIGGVIFEVMKRREEAAEAPLKAQAKMRKVKTVEAVA